MGDHHAWALIEQFGETGFAVVACGSLWAIEVGDQKIDFLGGQLLLLNDVLPGFYVAWVEVAENMVSFGVGQLLLLFGAFEAFNQVAAEHAMTGAEFDDGQCRSVCLGQPKVLNDAAAQAGIVFGLQSVAADPMRHMRPNVMRFLQVKVFLPLPY